MKTQTKPSIGTAINALLDASDQAATTLEDNGAADEATALRESVTTARAALKAVQPKPDVKEEAKRKEADEDAELDARLARER